MILSECPLRTRARIVSIEVGSQYCLRLKELGVRPGNYFYVVNRAPFGGVVVNIAGTRVAVDHRSAHSITVESVSEVAA